MRRGPAMLGSVNASKSVAWRVAAVACLVLLLVGLLSWTGMSSANDVVDDVQPGRASRETYAVLETMTECRLYNKFPEIGKTLRYTSMIKGDNQPRIVAWAAADGQTECRASPRTLQVPRMLSEPPHAHIIYALPT